MKIEKLNMVNGKKMFIIGLILGITIIIILNLLTSKAKYQNTQSINIVTGKISYTASDLNIVAVHQKDDNGEYQPTDNIPKSGYVLNKDDSYCTIPNDSNKLYNMLEFKDGKLTVDITKKGTKCYLYFEKQPSEQTLANLNLKSKGNKTTFTGIADKDEGIWEADDSMYGGTSYYFRGAVTNNYVSFAGFMWRIIRINGDGSLRLIYDGTTKHNNGDSTADRQIGTIAYNTSYGDNMYVGFRYESGKKQGNITPSTILGTDENSAANTLNKWYEDNIKGKPAENHIDKNAMFCNDRRSSTSTTTFGNRNNDGGTGTNTTYYGAYLRILPNNSWGSSQEATLSCEEADRFSAEGATKGNGTLIYPIGLITADEVVFAGGFGNKANQRYYLYTGQYYWTMSPYYFNGSGAFVFYVNYDGNLYYSGMRSASGVRPVINLKADTTFSSGNGSFNTPYEVS